MLHGTPAGGCGLFGLLSKGFVVVAMVHDGKHGEELRKALEERMCDAVVAPDGGRFARPDLVSRAAAAHPGGKKRAKKSVSDKTEESNSQETDEVSGEGKKRKIDELFKKEKVKDEKKKKDHKTPKKSHKDKDKEVTPKKIEGKVKRSKKEKPKK